MIFLGGVVHCDMHRGNMHLLGNGGVLLVDFGLVAEIGRKDRTSFAEFFYAFVVGDGYTCTAITLESATHVPPDLDKEAFAAEIGALVRRFSGKTVKYFQVAGFAFGMFDIQRRYGIRGTTAFVWSIIALLAFEGVSKSVDPELDFQTNSIPFVQEALNWRRLTTRGQ